jgi:hypothetical protein
MNGSKKDVRNLSLFLDRFKDDVSKFQNFWYQDRRSRERSDSIPGNKDFEYARSSLLEFAVVKPLSLSVPFGAVTQKRTRLSLMRLRSTLLDIMTLEAILEHLDYLTGEDCWDINSECLREAGERCVEAAKNGGMLGGKSLDVLSHWPTLDPRLRTCASWRGLTELQKIMDSLSMSERLSELGLVDDEEGHLFAAEIEATLVRCWCDRHSQRGGDTGDKELKSERKSCDCTARTWLSVCTG